MPSEGDRRRSRSADDHDHLVKYTVNMDQTLIVIALVVLVIALAALGAWTTAAMTIAATVIAGMLVFLPVRKD